MFCTDVIANRLGMVSFVSQNVRDSVFGGKLLSLVASLKRCSPLSSRVIALFWDVILNEWL